jgi:8-oxo-dGTP pyrophosphatase MutT (NUDIX family)
MLGNQNLMILMMLDYHETTFEEESKHRYDIFNFVKSNKNYWQRSNLAGHVTGSAWVLSPNGESVLLIHHKKLDRWLQPGGHVDAQDETIWATALRELVEETGLRDVSMPSNHVFDVDVHEIPARGEVSAHFHYDLRFLFQASTEALEADSSEVKDIRWVPILDLISEGIEQSIRRMALKSMEF